MTRVAIYARYSTDMQREASIEDQLRICRERVAREGWMIERVYSDQGISGSTLLRPGIQQLMADAQAGHFDIVLSESIDRLSRDQEDIAGLYKRFGFLGVKIVTLSEGEISELHIGLKGTMGALFLKDLADKTRRGLRGRVEVGRSGGGNCYGYDVVKSLEERGERTINEREAEVVRRIFRDYASGISPKTIAMKLNQEGIPCPRGNGWGASTIYGNRERGTGIINNELYIGKLVWNRLRYLKDPDTGRRVSRLNPEDQWIIKDVPNLRIVDDELWQAVRDRQKPLTVEKVKQACHARRPKYLFSGLMRCGHCGGGYSMISQTHIGCSAARNKGTCSNRKGMKMADLENHVLFTLQHRLMDEELCQQYCDEYTRHMNRLRADENARRSAYRAEIAAMPKKVRTMIDIMYEKGVEAAYLVDEMTALEARKAELEALLAEEEELPPLIHPNMAKVYRSKIADLSAALNDSHGRQQAAEIIRSVVDRIVLTDVGEKALAIDIEGALAGILALAYGDEAKGLTGEALIPASRKKQLTVVAGVGFAQRHTLQIAA